ncbi:hypothetical protein QFZ91_005212 [Paraburkholderia sp. JPY419]
MTSILTPGEYKRLKDKVSRARELMVEGVWKPFYGYAGEVAGQVGRSWWLCDSLRL